MYTLLAGKALDCIEHLETSEYQEEGGEQVIFQLLDSRFPQKDSSDEMSEVLAAVFNLRALEGESLFPLEVKTCPSVGVNRVAHVFSQRRFNIFIYIYTYKYKYIWGQTQHTWPACIPGAG